MAVGSAGPYASLHLAPDSRQITTPPSHDYDNSNSNNKPIISNMPEHGGTVLVCRK